MSQGTCGLVLAPNNASACQTRRRTLLSCFAVRFDGVIDLLSAARLPVLKTCKNRSVAVRPRLATGLPFRGIGPFVLFGIIITKNVMCSQYRLLSWLARDCAEMPESWPRARNKLQRPPWASNVTFEEMCRMADARISVPILQSRGRVDHVNLGIGLGGRGCCYGMPVPGEWAGAQRWHIVPGV